MKIPVSSQDQRRLYGDLAWAWPIISAREEYVKEAEEFCQVFRQYAQIEVKTLLHLGCGGGHLDYTLKKHLQVIGVDVSQDMLTLARRLNPEVTYLLGDMRTARLDQTFDAVMIADSIDYMLTQDDLQAAFETAFDHLRPGGVFCTYAEATAEKFRQNQTHCSIRARGDVEIVFIENYYDPNPNDSTYEMTFVYLIRRAGKLEVHTDCHLGGLFSLETWPNLLKQVGFKVEQVEFDQEGVPTFVCIKP